MAGEKAVRKKEEKEKDAKARYAACAILNYTFAGVLGAAAVYRAIHGDEMGTALDGALSGLNYGFAKFLSKL